MNIYIKSEQTSTNNVLPITYYQVVPNWRKQSGKHLSSSGEKQQRRRKKMEGK